MLRFSQYYKWNHLPLWDRKNGIGPWEYTKFDSHHSYACDQANEDPDVDKLEEKYKKIIEKMGVKLDELNVTPLEFLDLQKDDPKFKLILDSYYEEFFEIENKYFPKGNTYKWYQCFGACFFLAEWQERLARKVYREYDWCTYQKHKENASEWDAGHSTTIGKCLERDIIIFDILLFESTSTEEILKAAGVDQIKLQ
jgi:hypothetical protein